MTWIKHERVKFSNDKIYEWIEVLLISSFEIISCKLLF